MDNPSAGCQHQMPPALRQAVEDMRAGKSVILTDDPLRENEGDVVIGAEKITPQALTFMAKKASGLICLSLDESFVRKLSLPPMTTDNQESMGTAFTVSIDARDGITTGISAADRTRTILTAISPNAQPHDLVRPGHIFPLVAKRGGVLQRPGHTEASVELAKMAGLTPAAVICEIMGDNGEMLRQKALRRFAQKHRLTMISIEEIAAFLQETRLVFSDPVLLPTPYGVFQCVAVKEQVSGKEHLVLTKGDVRQESCIVRIHSECLTGDVMGSLRCDCGPQLAETLKCLQAEERGVLIYLRQEGRGVGLFNKIQTYSLQEKGCDTVEANLALGLPVDDRRYDVAGQIIEKLGLRAVHLLTNNPHKCASLQSALSIPVYTLPLPSTVNPFNRAYLKAKLEKMGHSLELPEENSL